MKHLLSVLLVTPANRFQSLFLFHSQGSSGQVLERVTRMPDVGGDGAWRIDDGRRVENRIEQWILRRA